jgi:hypothetical protein
MRITSQGAKDILLNLVRDVIKENNYGNLLMMGVMTGKRPLPNSNVLIGNLNKSIIEKYQDELSQIDGFSKYWQWAFLCKIIEERLTPERLTESNRLDHILQDIENKLSTTFPVISKIFMPFSIPPSNPIQVGLTLVIRALNEKETEFIEKINDINKKNAKQIGFLVQSNVIINPKQVVVFEHKIGNFTLDEITEMLDNEENARMYEKMMMLTYKPENEILLSHQLFLDVLKAHNLAVFGSELLILYEELSFGTEWINQRLTKLRNFNFQIITGEGNYQDDDFTSLMIPNLRILFKLVFEDKISQIRIMMSRFSLIINPRRPMTDKIVDAMVMYEALLTPRTYGNKSHKLAFRAALILEEEEEKRHEIYNFLLKIYKLRNKIVHGSSPIEILDFKEFGIFYKYSKELFIKVLNIYNQINYQEKVKNWGKILGKLDFYGFDTKKTIEEILQHS